MPLFETVPLATEIPPSDIVRHKLAAALTEAGLLRRLLKLAQLREREAARLARLAEQDPALAALAGQEVACA
jgi:hypothetical protein